MSDDKVVGLRGEFVAPGTPDPELVRRLEVLLEDARAGHIKAFAFVALKEADTMRRWFTSQPSTNNALVGAIRRMENDLINAIDGAP